MEQSHRIRFRQGDLEVEIEGDKEFVETNFNRLLQRLEISPPEKARQTDQILDRLLAQWQPASHSGKVLLFAYYLERYQGMGSFTAEDISRCYREARIPEPRNINDLIRKLPQGYVMEVGRKGKRKAWRLTRVGREAIERTK